MVKHLKRVENLSVADWGRVPWEGKGTVGMQWRGELWGCEVEHQCQVLGTVVFVSVGIFLALNSNTQ